MDVEQTCNKSKYRGKLYKLSGQQSWEDTGTGYVSLVGESNSRRLVFRNEGNGQILHDRPLFSSDVYQLQGESEGAQTIIVWEDSETKGDWALSFQDAEGTTDIWKAIAAQDEKKLVLPIPQLATLVDLSRALSFVPPSQRESLAAECFSPKFIKGLCDAFHTVEDLGNEEGLSSLWQIAKGIFLLSNQKLTERYLKHDVYEDIVGMLEYDDGLPVEKRIAHRQVLKVKVHFNKVLSFEDAETVERIHLNYRLQYLKDIVLPRLLDDAAFVSLMQMIHSNLAIILDHLQKNTVLLDQLLLQVRQQDLQSLLFLQDLCRLAKQIPPPERQSLYEKLVERNVFEALAQYFSEAYIKTDTGSLCARHLAVEVFVLSATNDASHFRRFLTSEESAEGRKLLTALFRLMLTEEDQGIQGQIADMLKAVMDPTNLDQRERENCLDVFYDRGALDELSAPLKVPLDGPKRGSCVANFGRQLACELIGFAVSHHGYRARNYVVRHGIIQHAARLLLAPQRFLQLAPVRLLRIIVGTKDEWYLRYLTKHGIFAPLLQSFQQCLRPPAFGGNVLVSAILDLFEVIRVEDIKILIEHICERHEVALRECGSKFKTLQGLLSRYQHYLEVKAFPPEIHASGGPISRTDGSTQPVNMRSPGREDSDNDEAYFESLDEEDQENSGTSGGGSGPGEPGVHNAAAAALCTGENSGNTALKGLLCSYEDDDGSGSDGRSGGGGGNATEDAAVAADGINCSNNSAVVINSAPESTVLLPNVLCSNNESEEGHVLTQAHTEQKEGRVRDGTENLPEAKAMAKDVEKSLNHVFKKLKTSPSGSA